MSLVMALLVGAGALALSLGSSAGSAVVAITDVGTWLATTSDGAITHVNGPSGAADFVVPLDGAQGHRLSVDQDGDSVLVVDLDTGEVSRIDPVTMAVTARRKFSGLALSVVARGGEAYVVDTKTGVITHIDPVSLDVLGTPVQVGAELGGAEMADDKSLWVTVPSTGEAIQINQGNPQPPVQITPPGNNVKPSVVDGVVRFIDETTGRIIIEENGKVGQEIDLELPGGREFHFPVDVEGVLLPVLVPGTPLVAVVDLGNLTVRIVDLSSQQPSDRLGTPIVADGTLYVPDEGTGRVILYDLENNRFEEPLNITVPGGHIDVIVNGDFVWMHDPAGPTAYRRDGSGSVVPTDKAPQGEGLPSAGAITNVDLPGAVDLPDPPTLPGHSEPGDADRDPNNPDRNNPSPDRNNPSPNPNNPDRNPNPSPDPNNPENTDDGTNTAQAEDPQDTSDASGDQQSEDVYDGESVLPPDTVDGTDETGAGTTTGTDPENSVAVCTQYTQPDEPGYCAGGDPGDTDQTVIVDPSVQGDDTAQCGVDSAVPCPGTGNDPEVGQGEIIDDSTLLASAPAITAVSTYQEGALVYLSVRYNDADGDAEGYGFDGANGSGWGRETHPFSSPSYGRVSPGQIDVPFNHGCGQGTEYESDVEFWIYDSVGNVSASTVTHLACEPSDVPSTGPSDVPSTGPSDEPTTEPPVTEEPTLLANLVPVLELLPGETLGVGCTPAFMAYIRNTGDVASGSFNISWDQEGVTPVGSHDSLEPGNDPYAVPAIRQNYRPGQHPHQWTVPLTAGTHQLTFVADTGNAVAESSETDNTDTYTFTVPADVTCTP